MVLDYCALIVLVFMVAVFVEIAIGYRKMSSLAAFDGGGYRYGPMVSIIVPACNEAETIAEGLQTLCAQDYEQFEIIVVNDRSTDATPEVIRQIAGHSSLVKTITIDSLPEGWLGKPHAMQKGAECAAGDFLLFTDADVQLEKSTVARAVHAMTVSRLDHLCLLFKNTTGGRLLNALICDAGAGLLYLFKPWRACRPKSRFFMGVGAFNMVRSSAYLEVGGHGFARMQAIDDVFLGRLIKWGGFRQECMLGEDFVRVPWYDSVTAMISGLMKNVYALFGYRPWPALAAAAAVACVTIVPVAGALCASGAAQLFFAGAVLVRLLSMAVGMKGMGIPAWSAVYLLITPLISSLIIFRSVWLAHRNKGVSWRGTRYPLDVLRGAPWLFSGFFSRKTR